jgi:hypothetical protein
MVLASFSTALMWALGYPAFAPESGPYRVGALQTRIPGSVACQVHYPADVAASDQSQSVPEFYPYMRPEVIEGVADFGGTSASLLSFLSESNHPCLINAEPVIPEDDDQKFPIVVFSHGLSGSMEFYTQLCQLIASHGFLVVAMEHEDGSAAYAETPSGEPIPFKKRDNDANYTRETVVSFRREFLEQRVKETRDVLDALFDASKAENLAPLLQKVLWAGNTTKGAALVGHSFGAASMFLTAQKYVEEMKSTNFSSHPGFPNSLSLLDPWAFALEDAVLAQGIPDTIPILSVLSEAYMNNPQTIQVVELLSNCGDVVSLYAPDSVHVSFTDSVSWVPAAIARRFNLRGKNEGIFQTIQATAQACVRNFQSIFLKDDIVSNSLNSTAYAGLKVFNF